MQGALEKVVAHWGSIRVAAAAESYVRRTMYRDQVSLWRRRRVAEVLSVHRARAASGVGRRPRPGRGPGGPAPGADAARTPPAHGGRAALLRGPHRAAGGRPAGHLGRHGQEPGAQGAHPPAADLRRPDAGPRESPDDHDEHRFEDRLQVALQDLADEVRPRRLLDRTPSSPTRPGGCPTDSARRPRRRSRRSSWSSPRWSGSRRTGRGWSSRCSARPRCSGCPARRRTSPGRAMMAVTLTNSSTATRAEARVPGAGRRRPVVAPPAQRAGLRTRVSQRLAADGRVLVRQNQGLVGSAYVLVDLASGRVQLLDDDRRSSSRSRRTAAPRRSTPGRRRAGRSRHRCAPCPAPAGDPGDPERYRLLPRRLRGDRRSIGWSPDGSLLAVQDGADTLVVDRRGELRARLRGAGLVNGSQSWSPDSQSLLVYDGQRAAFSVRDGSTGPRRPSCEPRAPRSGRSAGPAPGSCGSPAPPGSSGWSSADESARAHRDVDALRRRRRAGRGRHLVDRPDRDSAPLTL